MRRIIAIVLIILAFFTAASAEEYAINLQKGCAVIDRQGNKVLDTANFDMIFTLKNENGVTAGFAAGIFGDNDSVLYALVSPDGDVLTEHIYNYIEAAGNGFIACIRDDWYCLTSRGRVVGETYSAIEYAGNGVAFAVKGNPYDVISDELIMLYADGGEAYTGINVQYGLGVYSEGLMCIVDGDTLLSGYANASGAWAIEPVYEYAGAFEHGRAIVVGKRGYGLIDAGGGVIVDAEYDFLTYENDMVCAVKDDTMFIMDAYGGLVYKTALEGASASFTGGYAIITSAEEARVLDSAGAQIFTCDESSSVELAGNHFIVRTGGWDAPKVRLVSLSGNDISQTYDALAHLEDGMFAYGAYDAEGNMSYGLLSAADGALTGCVYSSIAFIDTGLYAAVHEDGFSLLNALGEEIPVLQ